MTKLFFILLINFLIIKDCNCQCFESLQLKSTKILLKLDDEKLMKTGFTSKLYLKNDSIVFILDDIQELSTKTFLIKEIPLCLKNGSHVYSSVIKANITNLEDDSLTTHFTTFIINLKNDVYTITFKNELFPNNYLVMYMKKIVKIYKK